MTKIIARVLCFLTGGHRWINLVWECNWEVCFKCRHERNTPYIWEVENDDR